MEEYNILNTIKPKFLRSKFPYNWISPEKIILTQKKITILAKEFKSNKSNKFGGNIKHSITFYG